MCHQKKVFVYGEILLCYDRLEKKKKKKQASEGVYVSIEMKSLKIKEGVLLFLKIYL